MAEVLNLAEARERRKRRRFDPQREFDAAMTVLFEAVDLVEVLWEPNAQAARAKLLEGLEILISRETEMYRWMK